MINFTPEEIQAKFDKLPKELQDALASPEVNETIQKVGNNHNMHINQIGEMVDLIGLIMLGLVPSKEFVKNFSQEAGVDNTTAIAIAEDVNNEVFGKIRSSMQAMQAMEEKNKRADQGAISSVEQAGDFSIETVPTGETLPSAPPTITPPPENRNINKLAPYNEPEKDHADPMVDHLLANPVFAVEKKLEYHPEPPVNLPTGSLENIAPPAPKPAPEIVVPKKPAGPDPYKEPIM